MRPAGKRKSSEIQYKRALSIYIYVHLSLSIGRLCMNVQMYAHRLAEWIFSYCSTSIHISVSRVAKSWGLGIISGKGG